MGFTLCESYLVSFICIQYEAQSVLLCAVLACVMFGTLCLYGMCTTGDLSYWGPIVSCMAMVGLALGFLTLLFSSHLLFMIYCWIGLLFTCVYTIYDVYLITQKHGLGYDDYIIGALLLYMDLISLFIYILSFLGERR